MKHTLPFQLFLAGSIAIDRIMNFTGKFEEVIKPEKLHVLSLSVLLDALVDTHGGTAANIAYNLAQLGETPILLGSVGANGRSYMEKLAKVGVNTEHVHYSHLPTATFTVMTDNNDCQVGGFFPGAMSDQKAPSMQKSIEGVGSTAPKNKPFIVISAHDPSQMKKQVALCKRKKYRLLYDPGQQVSNLPAEDLVEGLEAAEVVVVNDYEMDVLQKKTGWLLAQMCSTIPTIIVTLGEKGCAVYANSQQPKYVTAVPELTVVDPTGAGDAFRAGFLYGFIHNMPITESLQLGCVVASFVVEQKGTQEHTLSWSKIQQRYKKTYKTAISLPA